MMEPKQQPGLEVKTNAGLGTLPHQTTPRLLVFG